jgi:hypothetical protein
VPSTKEEHSPDQSFHESRPGQEQFGSQRSDVQLQRGKQYNRQSPVVRLRDFREKLVPVLPGYIASHDWNEEAMPHVLIVVPLGNQSNQNGQVTDNQQEAKP